MPEEIESKEELAPLQDELEELLALKIGKTRFKELQNEGHIPLSSDLSRLSYWVCEHLPEKFQDERLHLLQYNSLKGRLEKLLEVLHQVREEQKLNND